MSSIPVVGLAKTVAAVTILLHPAAHHATSYTVKPGDSLSAIADHTYGSSADWPAVWWANRRQVRNPDMISAGQRLTLPASGHVSAAMARAARAAASGPALAVASPSSSPQPAATASSQVASSPASSSQAAAPAAASSGSGNWGAIAACESGGNWNANTGNGFYGGLQFTEQTWLAYGGGQYASTANNASESQQIAVAQRVEAGQGIGAWPVCGAGG